MAATAKIAAFVFALLMAVCACAAGLKPNDPSAAKDNTRFIEKCRTDLDVPVGIIHIETPAHYRPNGGTIKGKGGGGLWTSEAAVTHDDNPLYQIASRFVPSNPAPDRDVLVLCGATQTVSDVQVCGRRWITSNTPPTGPRARACIAIEGHGQPPSGRHTIENVLCAESDVAIATLATPEETHADLLFVQNVYASQCRAFFQSANAQSVSHTFIHCFQESDAPMVGFEFLRGGKVDVFGFRQNGPFATLLAVKDDCAPNCNWFGMWGYHWDHVDAPGAYFCPLDSDKKTMTGCIVGHANNPDFDYEFRNKPLRKNPGLKFDVVGLGKVN